jgi:hypothetical protein
MAAPYVAGALAVLASKSGFTNPNTSPSTKASKVNNLYRKVKTTGNFDYVDKDDIKEPLLDMTNIPDAKMVGTC